MIREAAEADLHALLLLYTQLHGEPMPEITPQLSEQWQTIVNDPDHHVIVAEEGGKIVSSCVCVVVPNLTHGQRPYALIENVVTDAANRGRGLATGCLNFARKLAQREDCYKLMLLTGSKQESTLNFYRNAEYNSQDKTAFIQWIIE